MRKSCQKRIQNHTKVVVDDWKVEDLLAPDAASAKSSRQAAAMVARSWLVQRTTLEVADQQWA